MSFCIKYIPYHKNLIRKSQKIKKDILDFYCPEKKIGIEIDESQYYTKEGIEYDRNDNITIS